MGALLEKLKNILFQSKLEVVFIGLENSGKTTLLHQISFGEALPTAPTIGLNVKHIKKSGVQMKVWDIGGQVQYRNEWTRYTKGCDAIIFLIDASNVNPFLTLERSSSNLKKGIASIIRRQRVDRSPNTSLWKQNRCQASFEGDRYHRRLEPRLHKRQFMGSSNDFSLKRNKSDRSPELDDKEISKIILLFIAKLYNKVNEVVKETFEAGII